MKWLRFAGAAVVVAIAAWTLDVVCVREWRCSATVSQIERATSAMFAFSDALAVKASTRANLERLEPCLHACDASRRVEALMVLAAGYRILNDRPHAARAYREALNLDCRPEIYLNLAEVEYELGQRPMATRHFAMVMAMAPFLIDYEPGAKGIMTAEHIPTDILPTVLATVPAARRALIDGERL